MGVDLHLVDRVAHSACLARAVLERRRAGNQRPERRRERCESPTSEFPATRHRARRSPACLVKRGDRLRQLAFARRAVERIPPGFRNLATIESSTALPGPSGFSLLLMRMTSTPSGSAAGAPAPPATAATTAAALTSLAATGLTGSATGLHRRQFFVSARAITSAIDISSRRVRTRLRKSRRDTGMGISPGEVESGKTG